ncbi:amidophosphoribosyltransferase [Rhodanobacter sp. FDAARGOS 1247]|uniref:amidophosphoribosyltransferase n=1 Tax=unclassified Rhodanobacter TaxID=2621553 RepID=UPI0006FF5BF3|nr:MULTISPECIES: amidophosphoribosyltransferase [unclassified Rhodanobacter]KQZ74662.1 amidophosphoribosyltransferase [Rhodanobacter sp. Root561]QRP65210.1 amidophosphoribosyltransferase [Rhodanobacter sp. FDAARGOS 1247]
MCGIIGIVGTTEVASALYDGLTVLQHRGQDAAGIATVDGSRLRLHKGNGLVRDVFGQSAMAGLRGRIGIGHCRYPTAGSEGSAEAQPFYVNSPYGIAFAHNGNLVNTDALRREMFEGDRRHINTESDSEVLLNVLAHELQIQDRMALTPDHIFKAVAGVHARARGGYACIALLLGYGLIAFRDPNGIRPLVLGERITGEGREYAVASESVALDILGFKRIRDVAPGEAVIITDDGQLHSRRCAEGATHTPCIFEYVYLARPDSMIEDVSVYKARLRMGEKLAEKILRLRPDHGIDAVIPIPDTARTAASALAGALGVPFREGFVKNRYIGRTFIMPGQGERVKSVRRKLNAIDLEFRKKNVLLVDDSIVRGTTSKQIIQMARDAGAKNVYFASAAPPVRYPNVYGIDMPSTSELVAAGHTEQEVEHVLGADWLIYQDLKDLIWAVQDGNENLQQFDTSCFSGEYITGLDQRYLEQIEMLRSDDAKAARRVV